MSYPVIRDGQQVEFHLQAFPTCPLFHLTAPSFRCLRDKMEKCSAHDGKMQPGRILGDATFPSYLRAFSIMHVRRPEFPLPAVLVKGNCTWKNGADGKLADLMLTSR